MPKVIKLIDTVREFIKLAQGKEVDINYLRKELKLDPKSPAWDGMRVVLHRLVEERLLRPSGRKDGVYKVVVQVEPVKVFVPGRERLPPFSLVFPKSFDIMTDAVTEMGFAKDVVIREGDLILISGLSNYGKTTLCLNFCGENIDKRPILMGNEYTQLVPAKENPLKTIFVPSPRFLNRLEAMDWIQWVDIDGNDKFLLLPVREDYAEHIIKDRINIIDWINIETGEHYMIGNIMEGIKKQLGRGVAIVAIQKAEGASAGRGGQFTKDFADLELLIDKYGEQDTLLTIGKVKEYTKQVIGKTYGYSIGDGVKILNFREIKKCPECKGDGFQKGKICECCYGRKFIDK